jgi:S-adenosylhomocysteine hydrolase
MSRYSDLWHKYRLWKLRFQLIDARALDESLLRRQDGEQTDAINKYFESVVDESLQRDTKQTTHGHVTASAFVLDSSGKKLLGVLKPRYRNSPLQPGSQFVFPDILDPLELAIASVERDTGLRVGREHLITPFVDPSIPFLVDRHYISQDGHESGHYHIDFRYLFRLRASDSHELRSPTSRQTPHQPAEGSTAQWSDVEKWDDTVKLVMEFAYQVLNQAKPDRFFAHVARDSFGTSSSIEAPRTRTMIVAHAIPDILPYAAKLSEVSTVVGFIPKPNSYDKGIAELLTSKLGIQVFPTIDRQTIQDNPESIESVIEAESSPICLIDIGGYFAPIADRLAKYWPSKLRGIVEDTENGRQKYEELSSTRRSAQGGGLPIPVISVARSPLKDFEDWLIGQSVVYSADNVLRSLGILMQYSRCGVLGYGKIGRSIAQHLLARGARPTVFDIDWIRQVRATNEQCSSVGRDELLRNSELIFCATGAGSLGKEDLRKIRNGAVIFSVTSGDDEFEPGVFDDYPKSKRSPDIRAGTDRRGRPVVEVLRNERNYFYLVANGNAVNFLHNAVCGEFIHLVRAEMISATGILASQEVPPGLHDEWPSIVPLRNSICERWASVFRSGSADGYDAYLTRIGKQRSRD